MELLTILVITITIAIFFFFFISGDSDENKNNNEFELKPGTFITEHEKVMFKLIEDTLPDVRIFIQVSFSALIDCKDRGVRNKFNRLRTDYVVTDREFNILAVIELDDRSHKGKEERDRKRDKMLMDAGYKVLRYPRIPTANTIKNDIYRRVWDQ